MLAQHPTAVHEHNAAPGRSRPSYGQVTDSGRAQTGGTADSTESIPYTSSDYKISASTHSTMLRSLEQRCCDQTSSAAKRGRHVKLLPRWTLWRRR